MEWLQVLTTIGTILAGIYVFYQFTNERINHLDQIMVRMDANHREDIKRMEEKWERLFERVDNKIAVMDEKWEHLFERLLLQDKKNG
jgi:hypothetical protein